MVNDMSALLPLLCVMDQRGVIVGIGLSVLTVLLLALALFFR
jgi:hypothetical protein